MNGDAEKKAVILLSGGLDSAVTLAKAASQGFACYAMSFNYGQRHKYELKYAKKIARSIRVKKHLILKINLRKIGASALTDSIKVPEKRSDTEINRDIPVTYVPARNIIFLSCALSWAEALKAENIFIGVNALDYSGYPDCRPEFIASFEKTAHLGTKKGTEGSPFTIHAPLQNMTKKEIILAGAELGVDFSLTGSCYNLSSRGISCGICDACLLRKRGFEQAGLSDPVRYRKRCGARK